MRSISWKHPLIALAAAGIIAASSSDENPTTTPEGGTGNDGGKCGHGKVDDGEECDPKKTVTQTCAMVMMGSKPNGMLTCNADCTFNTSKCTSSGTGGGGGASGSTGTGGVVGMGGAPKGDGGPDAMADAS